MSATSTTADREIHMERLVDAPRALVFKVWTSADHLPKWMCPQGFEIETTTIDAREGGTWTYTMTAPDGTVFANFLRFDQLKPVEQLRYAQGTAADDIWFTVTVTFAEEGGKTRIRSTHLFNTAEGAEQARQMGAVELGKTSWDKMETRVLSLGLQLERTFDAPKALVYQAITEGDRLAKWWGPKGFGMDVKRADVRPGGDFHYRMHNDAGVEMWGRLLFLELEPTDRVSYISTFSDSDGGITRAPFLPSFPARTYNVLTLTEAHGKTTLRMRGGPIDATPEELAAFEGMYASMKQGFGNAFDQLAALLAEG